MLTEFEIRRRIQTIRTLVVTPRAKARMLLRISRALHGQEKALRSAYARSKQAGNRNGTSHMERMVRQTRALCEEVRSEASDYLVQRSGTFAA